MSTATEAGHLRGILMCACAGFVLLAGTATAGVTAGVTADSSAVTITEPSAVSAADLNRAGELKRAQAQAQKGRASLKCYQEGKLVHESTDVILPGRQAGVITLQSASNGHPVLQLIDLKGGLCLVESRLP